MKRTEDSWECGACGKQTHVTHFRTGTDGSMVHAPESPLTDISPVIAQESEGRES